MKILHIICALGFLSTGCITSYNLEHDTNELLLVVDGKITQKNVPHELVLRRSSGTGSTDFNAVLDARITLFDGVGNYEEYYQEGNGTYVLNGEALLRTPGKSYYIEIELPNQHIYRSYPQTMPEVIKPEKLYFEVEKIEELGDLENTITKRYINFYINTPLFNDNEEYNFIWRMDHAFSFAELKCHPLQTPKTCFILRKLVNDDIKIFSGMNLSGGKLEGFRVGSILVSPDWEFYEKHFFNVAQHSISREAFEYWDTVKKVAQSTGSIFDTPPAPISGNIYNVDDPEERVLGFFEVSSVDTIRTYTFADDLEPLVISDRCSPYEWRSFRDPVCCNCLEIPDSQVQRPYYWSFLLEEDKQ